MARTTLVARSTLICTLANPLVAHAQDDALFPVTEPAVASSDYRPNSVSAQVAGGLLGGALPTLVGVGSGDA